MYTKVDILSTKVYIIDMADDKRFVRLNFSDIKSYEIVDLTAEAVPNIIPDDILNLWIKNDTNPYYKIQMIEYPITANGLIYEESFFESFLSKLKYRPIPGSRSGHSLQWGARPPTDLLLIGGKIIKNGDGTGRVFFKNYIPPNGESGDNNAFILANKSGLVHYSLVTYPEEIIETGNDGNIVRRIVASISGERNDAVEYEMGAMAQTTNSGVSAKNKNTGEDMTNNEILDRLKTLRANGDIKLSDITSGLGIEVVTEKHRDALTLKNALAKQGIDDPLKTIAEMSDTISKNEEMVKSAMLAEIFGPSEISEKNGKKIEKNLALLYAKNYVKNRNDVETAIEELKTDPIARQLNANALAGESSEVIGIAIERPDKKNSGNHRRVDKL